MLWKSQFIVIDAIFCWTRKRCCCLDSDFSFSSICVPFDTDDDDGVSPLVPSFKRSLTKNVKKYIWQILEIGKGGYARLVTIDSSFLLSPKLLPIIKFYVAKRITFWKEVFKNQNFGLNLKCITYTSYILDSLNQNLTLIFTKKLTI